MAKAKAAGSANKVSFGKKTTGKAKKGYGPKGLYENTTKDRENPQYIFYTIS